MIKDAGLIVGIEEYSSDDIDNIKGAKDDTQKIVKWLANETDIEIVRLPESYAKNKQVSSKSIGDAIGHLFASAVGVNDYRKFRRIYIYFSAHGFSQNNSLGNCILTSESRSPTKPSFISIEELKRIILAHNICDELVVILDACRIKAELKNGNEQNVLPYHVSQDATLYEQRIGLTETAVINSCSDGRESFQLSNEGVGVFTKHFLETVYEIKGTRKKNYTPSELIQNVNTRLVESGEKQRAFYEPTHSPISFLPHRNRKKSKIKIKSRFSSAYKIKEFKIKNIHDGSYKIFQSIEDYQEIELHPFIYRFDFLISFDEGIINNWTGLLSVANDRVDINQEFKSFFEYEVVN